jgi:hypothetical protein
MGGELAEEHERLRKQKALMRAKMTAGGSVTVDCPYCLVYWRLQNAVDVTRFIDGDGKRECKTTCSKGHTLRFRQIDQWREERQRAGIQSR